VRLDKFLKVSRLIKRRTLAKEACLKGRISINSRTAKPGSEVKPGDVLVLLFGDRSLSVEVLKLAEKASSEEASKMYRVIAPVGTLPLEGFKKAEEQE